MKILQVHTRYREPGGEDAVVRAEADLLRSAGHTVLTHEDRNPDTPVPSAAALAVAPWNAASKRAVRRVADEHRPDVAHVHNTWYALSPAVFSALHQAGVPTVATLHNYRLLCTNGLLFRDGQPCQDCVGTHPWHGVRHRCYRNSAVASAAVAGTITAHRIRGTWERDVDLFLALTEFGRQRFIAGGLPADRIRVKPNFVPDPGPRLRSPQDSDVVLYVGRLSPEKGVEEAVRAWAATDRAPLRLQVIGDGPLRERLEAVRAPRVEVLGPRSPDEVRRLMLSSRALLFPSRWYETFGLVVVEAMAAGLPVLAADLGGIRELLGEDATHALVPPDANGWVPALRRLQDAGWLEEAARRGRLRYDKSFNPGTNLALLEDAYRAAAASHRSRP